MTVKKTSRQLIALLLLFFISGCIYGQNWDTLPWKSYANYKLQPLNKTYVTTRILYDRVFPIANMDEYTGSLSFTDTTHLDHFMQAYYEIYNSAFNTSGWTSPEQMDSIVKYNGGYTQHPIGVFLYKSH